MNYHVNLVVGIPGSGKTTFVKNSAGRYDIVYDLDALASALNPEGLSASRYIADNIVFEIIDRFLDYCDYNPDYNYVMWIITTKPSRFIDGMSKSNTGCDLDVYMCERDFEDCCKCRLNIAVADMMESLNEINEFKENYSNALKFTNKEMW